MSREYVAVRHTLQMSPTNVPALVTEANLKGCGGAAGGFGPVSHAADCVDTAVNPSLACP
jgi:NADH:ubiquinone oxidoreductase subunit F (NADH-binding)